MMYKRCPVFVLCLLVAATTALAACGNDTCEDATEKVSTCTGQKLEMQGECSGTTECVATCWNNATCDEINASFPQPAPGSKLAQCAEKCMSGTGPNNGCDTACTRLANCGMAPDKQICVANCQNGLAEDDLNCIVGAADCSEVATCVGEEN